MLFDDDMHASAGGDRKSVAKQMDSLSLSHLSACSNCDTTTKFAHLPPSTPPSKIEDSTELSVDEVAIIFSFLGPREIIRARLCNKWRQAAEKSIVPLSRHDLVVKDERSYNAVRVMSTALPNLQYLEFDANEQLADDTGHDISFISNFRKLRILELSNCYQRRFTSRYSVFFNFPLLQELHIAYCDSLEWDLAMLAGLPSLKVLSCRGSGLSYHPTGNLSSLRALKNTLEEIYLTCCSGIRGDFMNLADFPCLKTLKLEGTPVTGDLRDICDNHFTLIRCLQLPETVVGGREYKFGRISDVCGFMQSIHNLLKRPRFREIFGFGRTGMYGVVGCPGVTDMGWQLHEDSPDWYSHDDFGIADIPSPPFWLQLIQVGPRLGWCWYGFYYFERFDSFSKHLCEINWLDPEPSSERKDYKKYLQDLELAERPIKFCRGYHQPPTEEEYCRMSEDI